jgi:hypothetical protein
MLFVPLVALAVILFVPFVPVAERVFDWLAALAEMTLLPAVAVIALLPVVAVIVLPVPPVNWFCAVAFRTLFVPAVIVLLPAVAVMALFPVVAVIILPVPPVIVFVAAACIRFVPPEAVDKIWFDELLLPPMVTDVVDPSLVASRTVISEVDAVPTPRVAWSSANVREDELVPPVNVVVFVESFTVRP